MDDGCRGVGLHVPEVLFLYEYVLFLFCVNYRDNLSLEGVYDRMMEMYNMKVCTCTVYSLAFSLREPFHSNDFDQ